MQQIPDVQLPDVERVRIRLFTLADHAATPPDGKFYVSGGGIHNMGMPTPGPIAAPLFLMIRLAIPYHDTNQPHHLRLRLLDEDRQPVGQDPLVNFENLEVGRAPGTRPGDENSINVVIGLTGYPIERTISRELRCLLHLEFDGQELDTLPLKLIHVPQQAGRLPRSSQ